MTYGYYLILITLYKNAILLFVFLNFCVMKCFDPFCWLWPLLPIVVDCVAQTADQKPEYLSNWLQAQVYSVHLLRFNNKCSLNW